jgi:uncharacterized protein (DUF362 family)
MERRDFLKKSIVYSFGTALTFSNYQNARAGKLPYDLVAIKGGEPENMFDSGIASLGGMKAFVKKGQTVVVKPNIGWDVPPERAGNTNPKLVAQIIKHCYQAGAKTVYVFDNTCDNAKKAYANSGIERAVKEAGGKIVSGASESYYQKVSVKGGKSLKDTKVHELILSSDVFINVPILKSHSSTKLTMAMKNLMGVVWDRRYWHSNNLNQCIADYCMHRKPDLNIIDAYLVLKQNGPRGVSLDDVVSMKSQIISTDIVAADAAGAKTFGLNPDDISYIKIADAMKLGTKNLDSLKINRIKMG